MNDPTQAPGPVLTVPGAPLAIHVMAKPTGAVCNLDCEYCFFLSKEMLYPGSRFRMAEELPSRSSSATEQTLPIADSGWGSGVKGRPLYTQEGNLVTHRSVGPAQYGRFMIEVFEDWVRHDIGTAYVQMFDTTLANVCGEPGGMCVHAETCGQQLAIEHTGDVYSCDHYVEPGYLLRANRAPAELMRLYETRDARRGRNEPCTCGSGRKRKRCHGRPAGGDPAAGDDRSPQGKASAAAIARSKRSRLRLRPKDSVIRVCYLRRETRLAVRRDVRRATLRPPNISPSKC
jgi:uncharacterized protein